MQEEERLLKFYKSAYFDKFKKFAQPLDIYFNIDTFGYSHISPKGDFFQISNQPELSEFYFLNKLYKTNCLLRHPDNFYSCAIFPNAIDNEIMQSDQARVPNLQLDKFLAIYKKQEKDGHLFLFAIKNQQVPISSIFLNNLSIIDKFCSQFLNEWKYNLRKMDTYMINLAELVGQPFFENKPFHFGTELNRKKKFLQSLSLIGEELNHCSFTAREKDCMRALLEGMTIKEIAQTLHLSPRTIENYYENLKFKLCCDTKSEVIRKIQVLQLLDF